MAAHLFLEPPTVAERSMGRAIPAPLEDLVKRALAKAAAARPTAEEFRHELTSILKGTDPATLAEHAGRERVRLGALSRSERAFTGSRPAAPSVDGAKPRVAICIRDKERASAIAMALAVSGAAARVDAESPAVVVLAHGEWDGGARYAELTKRYPGVPTIVVDVPGAEATTAVIRAGVSDMMLAGSPARWTRSWRGAWPG